MKQWRMVSFLLCCTGVPGLAAGQNNLSVTAHVEQAQVKAHELVYIQNSKVSELIWDTPSATLVGVDIKKKLEHANNVVVNVSLSTLAGTADSVMDDYDWLKPRPEWSEWSHHEQTTLETAFIADINLAKTVHSNAQSNTTLDLLLGFRRDQWAWKGVGGTYIYSSQNGFRDLTGVFPNIPGIRYEQAIDTPYIGVDFDWKPGKFSFGAKVIGSTLVSAKATDNHYLRNTLFTDTFRNGEMVAADIRLSYQANKRTRISLMAHQQKYFHNRGNELIQELSTGAAGINFNGAGMTLDESSVGLAVSYQY